MDKDEDVLSDAAGGNGGMGFMAHGGVPVE
jgi:hypothetical protein